jgi:D-sedoheptulose 7-phosphate isomerase
LVAITTSGNSENIRQAVTAAKAAGVGVIALTGRNGGQLAEELDANHLELRVPDTSTARIQESHAIIIHCLCDLIELHVTENSG